MTKKILLMIFPILFLASFLFGISSAETSESTVHKTEAPAVINLLEDDGEQDFSGIPGKIYPGPQIANTVAPARQLCNSAMTRRDYQHNSTIGRQLVYGGYYNAAFDYVFMIYTYTWHVGATPIHQVNYAVFDWTAGIHDWDFDCCDVKVGTDNSRYCNMDAVPVTAGTSLPVIAYHHSADGNSPIYTLTGFTNAVCTDQFTKDTLPGPPCVPDVQTGYCGDVDATETPYIWPKIDVQVGPNDSIITHVASNEAGCGDEPADAIEISSAVYYRKASDPGDPISGTWSSPLFMDSVYSICQHVVAEKFGPNVYYVYLKPMYYYCGTTHPCEANGLGHYQQTNDIVYRQSTDYGRTWGGRTNITNYGPNGFEAGNTEPANSDITCMVDPTNVLHIVWGSANRPEDNICSMLYAMKMWHWDSFNNCISIAYDAGHPAYFSGALPRWDHVVTQQNVSWCDDKLYITFVRFGAHPVGDTSLEIGAGPTGADTLYQVADFMVVASDATGGMGKSWTAAFNLTNTDGTNCPPGSCENEVYPFMAPYMNDSLMIEYIRDLDAGAWLVGEGSRTDNPVMFMTWPCFTMADVGTNCAYVVTPDPPEWDEVALAPNGSTAGCTTPASYSDSVILANGGNVDITYTAVSDSPSWLTVTGGAAGTASAGAGPMGLPNGCASPAIINWTASSATLAAGNYTGTITVDIVDPTCGDFNIVVNAVVACSYFEPEYARLTGGCWTVDVWNVPWAGHQGDNEGENWDGDIKFYACGGDSTIHPLYNEAFMVGWNDGTIKCYGQMMGEEFDAGMRALDSIQVTAVGNPAGGQGYWKSYGKWCTPDSLVVGTIEYIVPGHQDSAVLIEKIVLWNDGGVSLNDFVAGEGIDWDVRSDSNYDDCGIDFARNMVYQRGCRQMDSVVAGMHCYYGHDALIGATVVDNHDYIYDHSGYHPDTIYNLMTGLDGTFSCFQDSCTDLNSVYRFWEGTLGATDTLKFCKVKAVSLDGVTGLQEFIDKGIAYILIHNLCGTVEVPPVWPGTRYDNQDGFVPEDGNPIGTNWHELWPNYCEMWTLTSWIDSDDDGELSFCDTIDFTHQTSGDIVWEHVKAVVPTIWVTEQQTGDTAYFDMAPGANAPTISPNDIDYPVGSYWHEIYPTYCIVHQIVRWKDNDNGYLDYCDTIWMHQLTGEGYSTVRKYHVKEIATDLVTTRVPTGNMHNRNNYRPNNGDPRGTRWHELYPNYCRYWKLTSWIDNGDGKLSRCDTVDFTAEDNHEVIWRHIRRVVPTIKVRKVSDPVIPIYLDQMNENPLIDPIEEPVCTYWHEIYPNYCKIYHIDSVDDNGNGYLDSCDYILLHSLSPPDSCTREWYHVEGFDTDIETAEVDPPSRIGMWYFHPTIVNGWLTVWGTINCVKQEPPLFIRAPVLVCNTYGGAVPHKYNDVLIKFEWDWICGNIDYFKITVPYYNVDHWQLYGLSSWIDYVLEDDSVVLPSVGDSTGQIQNVYVLVNPEEWMADPMPFQSQYTVINGECPDLPGYLIGTTEFVYDSMAGPSENPFSTTPLTGTLYMDGEVILTIGEPSACEGICGDANDDGTVNVSDAVKIINYVFVGGNAPVPLACGDANGDGTVNVSDAVKVINYVFVGGGPPGDCAPGSENWHDGDCCPFE